MIINKSATEMAQLLNSGEITSVELTNLHLDRIKEVDDKVKAFLYVDHDGALEQATLVDNKRKSGEKLSPLAGVPLALKDVMTQKGIPTTCGSKILEGWRPPYDSTVVSRLKASDVVILGKTNCDEFAMGSSTENSAFFPTHNPWDLTRIPGGSGGGSSASLAAFQAPLAIGTDTGGSIRQPAAVTGTVGVKPTYGPSLATDSLHSLLHWIKQDLVRVLFWMRHIFMKLLVGMIHLIQHRSISLYPQSLKLLRIQMSKE